MLSSSTVLGSALGKKKTLPRAKEDGSVISCVIPPQSPVSEEGACGFLTPCRGMRVWAGASHCALVWGESKQSHPQNMERVKTLLLRALCPTLRIILKAVLSGMIPLAVNWHSI